MALRDRFVGAEGEHALRDVIRVAKLVQGHQELTDALVKAGEVVGYEVGSTVIEQGADDNDIYILVAGNCNVVVNGRMVGRRGPGDHVGEMAAIEPSQQRSASIVAATEVVALKVSEPNFHSVAHTFPLVYKDVARELSRRLLQRNTLVGAFRDSVRLFIISSVESLPVARAIQNAFEYDPFRVVIWTDGVFKIANYTLQSLEDEVDKSDFAIAIAHADDVTSVRGADWPSPRDNVVFELGLFMGRLGRARAILMEPREERVKLPSDLAGVTTIPYRFEKGADAAASIGPACNRLRDHINALGPNNG
ncbi:TIR domain-containing protein [Ferrovibrio sp.]|uniref:TIR domain-containing protein n=1 Tax=Ferrovibrio sp. TaxID=1917215 RepID=UPI003D2A10FC